jgi:uncharacterized spore protein YtfJ
MISNSLKKVFSRAGDIIGECIEVDGVIFLDASVGTFGGFAGGSYDRLSRLEVAREQGYSQ